MTRTFHGPPLTPRAPRLAPWRILTATLACATCLTAMSLPAPARAEGDLSLELMDRYTYTTQALVTKGMEYLGVRYRRGGTTPETGLDCSGLVQNLFRTALGLDLPRTAREMAAFGRKIAHSDLEPGDLVFFNTMRRTFSHVGVYLGEGRFLHAPASGGRVRIEDMGKPYWTARYNGARRVVPEAAPGTNVPE